MKQGSKTELSLKAACELCTLQDNFEVAEITQDFFIFLNRYLQFNEHIGNHNKQLKFMESRYFRHLFNTKFLIKEL